MLNLSLFLCTKIFDIFFGEGKDTEFLTRIRSPSSASAWRRLGIFLQAPVFLSDFFSCPFLDFGVELANSLVSSIYHF